MNRFKEGFFVGLIKKKGLGLLGEYLLKNNLLSNRQYGFIKGRSTLLQLLNMLDNY